VATATQDIGTGPAPIIRMSAARCEPSDQVAQGIGDDEHVISGTPGAKRSECHARICGYAGKDDHLAGIRTAIGGICSR
jgi:hypothetical protein